MSTDVYLASPRPLPSLSTLETWFDGGAERRDEDTVVLAQTTAIWKVTLRASPPSVRRLPASRRKVIMCATLGNIDTLSALARALGGTLFGEDGKRIVSYSTASPPERASRPAKNRPAGKSSSVKRAGVRPAAAIDVSIPPTVATAFLGHHLPILALRAKPPVKLEAIGAKLPAARKSQLRYLHNGDFLAGRLEATYAFLEPFAGELAQLKLKNVVELLRVKPREWFALPVRADEELALSVLCALARLTRGVLYSRPGGRKLQQTEDKKVHVSFDFASGDPR